jgi:hypothetical protein
MVFEGSVEAQQCGSTLFVVDMQRKYMIHINSYDKKEFLNGVRNYKGIGTV